MEDVTDLLSPLAEPTRLRALRLLWDGPERCVCDLMRELDAMQPRMSRHVALLKRLGLVVERREAQWVRYRRNPDLAEPTAAIVAAVPAGLSAEARRKAA